MKKYALVLATSLLIANLSFSQRGVVGEKSSTTKAKSEPTELTSSPEKTVTYPQENELRVSFLDFFNSEFLLSYEHLFKNNTGLVVNGGMILKQTSSEEKLGGEGELQYRLYMRPNYKKEPGFSFNGIYTGPYIFYKYLDKTNYSSYYNYYDSNSGSYIDNPVLVNSHKNANYSTVGVGVIVGMKFIIAHRISIDLNVGGGLKYTDTHPSNAATGSSVFDEGYTGVAPRGKITFGLRF